MMQVSQEILDALANGTHSATSGPHAGKLWWGWGSVDGMREHAPRILEARAAAHSDDKHAEDGVIAPLGVHQAGTMLREPRIKIIDFDSSIRHLFKDSAFERLFHSRGRDFIDIVRNARGLFENLIDLVAYPTSEADVTAVLQACADRHIAVMPFGGGSSVVGGVEPPHGANYTGAISLDMALMKTLLEVDEVSMCCHVQGGIYGPELEKVLKPYGLTLRYYPQSFEFSTVGGWIATRGGGHFATGPTHIDDLVESVTVVSPMGTTTTRRLPASGAGPSEPRMYLGSEGQLGVITSAWLRLRRRPRARASATVLFIGEHPEESFLLGAAAVREVVQCGVQPANCRLVDGVEVARVLGAHATTLQREQVSSAAVLLLGFEAENETSNDVLDAQLALVLRICVHGHSGLVIAETRAAGTTGGPPSGERTGVAGSWGTGFMAGGYYSSAGALLSDTIVNTFETACTWAAFPALHRAVLAATHRAIQEQCGVDGTVTCRFTHVYPDGPAPYYTVVVHGIRAAAVQDKNAPTIDARIPQWQHIKKAAMDAIICSGGTSTHHHAVGRLHRPHFEAERGAIFGDALAALKHTYDPNGIMAPGVLLPERPGTTAKL
eukprot:m.623150 g.623150  ORF g.623150 m.623150 type:complete len:608 (+) comp22544_c0_seq11:155-1978(+)